MLRSLKNISPTSKSTSKGKKVFVGLSGGVDSAVSAALLKEQGYEVTGVFIKVWQPDFLTCTWREERRDAMRVAARLNIPFLFFDFSHEYKRGVADYMIDEYRKGRTPNPDVMCNREIKFGAFWQKAKELGADYIATGHYLSGKNDQTYFLWMLTQEDFDHTLFPVGHMEKVEVRGLARKYDLPTADKKDSQGLCFLGDVDMKEFLSHFVSSEPGNVLNTAGVVIGRHDGAIHYTLGERHGFEIFKKTTHARPMFVVSKDMGRNTITVAEKVESYLPNQVRIEKANWLAKPDGKRVLAQIRYKGDKIPVQIANSTIKFEVAEAAAPGQSIVFYEGEKCIGGAIIK